MKQTSFISFEDNVAPYYAEPVKALCRLIDMKTNKGKKVGDLIDYTITQMNRRPAPQPTHEVCLHFARMMKGEKPYDMDEAHSG